MFAAEAQGLEPARLIAKLDQNSARASPSTSPADSLLTFEMSTPKASAAARWRSGFDAPVNLKTAGAVTATDTPCGMIVWSTS